MYDTEVYPAAGAGRIQWFVNSATIAATAAAKTLAETNMTQNGNLGTPLEFDLIGFNFEIERGISLADHNLINNQGVFIWIFGQNTPWLNLPITRIAEGVALAGATTANNSSILSNGVAHATNFYNFSVDRRARHIFSNESFHGELQYPNGVVAITAARRIRLYMLGVLFGQL